MVYSHREWYVTKTYKDKKNKWYSPDEVFTDDGKKIFSHKKSKRRN